MSTASIEDYRILLWAIVVIIPFLCMAAFVVGDYLGVKDYRKHMHKMMGTGTLWRVGEDGKLYEVKEDE